MACQVTEPGSFNLSIVHHDQYSAYLVLCHRGASFSGDVKTTFLNLAPEGGLTQHLAIQQAMLPALFTVSFVPVWLCTCVVHDRSLLFVFCIKVGSAVSRRQSRLCLQHAFSASKRGSLCTVCSHKRIFCWFRVLGHHRHPCLLTRMLSVRSASVPRRGMFVPVNVRLFAARRCISEYASDVLVIHPRALPPSPSTKSVERTALQCLTCIQRYAIALPRVALGLFVPSSSSSGTLLPLLIPLLPFSRFVCIFLFFVLCSCFPS